MQRVAECSLCVKQDDTLDRARYRFSLVFLIVWHPERSDLLAVAE